MAQISAAASTALSTSYAALECTGTTSGEAQAVEVPDGCYLEDAHLQLDTIAGGATSITWLVAADAAGDVPLTNEITTTIVPGTTTATDGAVVEILGKLYQRYSVGVGGSVFIFAKTNAGTANAIARLTWNLTS
jgi:hypothetical protein